MSQLQERIDQFRKMAQDDPDNDFGHFRLGQLFVEAGQLEEAAGSFRRTLELSPSFSKVYQLLGSCLLQLGREDEAAQVLKQGYVVADEHGDYMPRDEMAKILGQMGKPVPAASQQAGAAEAGDGFRCQRPGCMHGRRAHQLQKPPIPDELGQRIYETICADCWNDWLRNVSIKVINELRLDLSRDAGQDEYDRYMRDYLGFEQQQTLR